MALPLTSPWSARSTRLSNLHLKLAPPVKNWASTSLSATTRSAAIMGIIAQRIALPSMTMSHPLKESATRRTTCVTPQRIIWIVGVVSSSPSGVFFWFKTWSVGSSHPGMTHCENLKCNTIDLCLHSFFAEAYKLVGMVKLDELLALKWVQRGVKFTWDYYRLFEWLNI